MILPRIVTVAAILTAVGLCTPARADDDNRPLPSHEDVAVSMDDVIRISEDSYPALKLADSKLVKHGTHWAYQVQLVRGNKVRTLKFDCSTGQTLVNRQSTAGTALLNKLRGKADQLSGVTISQADAIAAAEAAVPGAKAYEAELDDFNDQPAFKVKLLDGTRRVTVYVDAMTGKVIDQPGDGVVNLSLDEAAARARELYPDWKLLRVQLHDDRDDDDSGSYYRVSLINTDGTQRRELKLDANTGSVLQDRLRNVASGNVGGFHDIAGQTPQITPEKAGSIATDAVPGSRVREISLKFEEGVLAYHIHLINGTGGETELKVNAMTGDIIQQSGNPGGGETGAVISYTQAAMIAQGLFPNLRIREVEVESEHGATFYKVQMVDDAGNRSNVFIDASNGQVVGDPSGADDNTGIPDGAAISYSDAARIASELNPTLSIREVELETEHGVLVFKVHMISPTGVTSEVLINANTGLVVDDSGGGGGGGGGTPVDADQASAIALAMFSGSTIREISSDTEEGIPVFEVSLNTSTGRVDVTINANTGDVLRVRTR